MDTMNSIAIRLEDLTPFLQDVLNDDSIQISIKISIKGQTIEYQKNTHEESFHYDVKKYINEKHVDKSNRKRKLSDCSPQIIKKRKLNSCQNPLNLISESASSNPVTLSTMSDLETVSTTNDSEALTIMSNSPLPALSIINIPKGNGFCDGDFKIIHDEDIKGYSINEHHELQENDFLTQILEAEEIIKCMKES